MGVRWRTVGVAALCTSLLTASAARAAQPLGALTQLPGAAGCFTSNGASNAGAGTCSQARGLAEGESAIVSPDGRNVYVGSYPNGAGPGYTIFARDSSTGALSQLSGKSGCLTTDGSYNGVPGQCTEARGLITSSGDGRDIAFTSDGRWAYIVPTNTLGHGAVMIFQRDPATGALTQLAGSAGCITPDGSDQDGAGQCQTDALLNGPSGVSISPDDRFLYVIDYYSPTRIHVFSRNTATGGLTEIQCISEAPVPLGCSLGRVLGNSQSLVLSPDGMHAYGGEYQHGLSIFDRDPATGLLTQKLGTAGCITDNGMDDQNNPTCTVGRVVRGSYAIVVAPNGSTLYDTAGYDGGFSVFHINADGTLTQLTGANGCVTIDGNDNTGASTCTIGRAIKDPYGGAVSPDGRTLYVSERNLTPGGLAVFSLDPTTGVATQLAGLAGCVTVDGSSNGSPGQCAGGRALANGYGLSVSPDGNSVYQATSAPNDAGLAVYRRETGPACQGASAAAVPGSPVTVSLHCSDTDGDPVTRSIVSGPAHGTLSAINNATGTVSYTPSVGFSGADTFTFAATDGINQGPSATATIAVTPATLSGLHVSPSKLSLSGRKLKGRCVKTTGKNSRGPRCRLPIKLRVSYTLNGGAAVTITLSLKAPGERVGHRCVKPTKHNGKHPRCTRLVSVRGTLTQTGKNGANKFTFDGKIGGHKLGPGTYELIAKPTGGAPKTVTFKITT